MGTASSHWLAIKLVLTALATLLLMVHMRPMGFMAEQAAMGEIANAAHRQVRLHLVIDAAVAFAALLMTTILSMYKPRG